MLMLNAGSDHFTADLWQGAITMRANYSLLASFILSTALLTTSVAPSFAQGNSKKSGEPVVSVSASIALTRDMQVEIRDWYVQHPVGTVEALPPGIRKRLARGKPLPPGIAKQVAPEGLRSRVRVPKGYEIMEVGLDVLLVEIATSVVHDILTDVVR
jgi:hypothetical protein